MSTKKQKKGFAVIGTPLQQFVDDMKRVCDVQREMEEKFGKPPVGVMTLEEIEEIIREAENMTDEQ